MSLTTCQSRRCAHAQSGRAVSVWSGAAAAERHVQRHVSFAGTETGSDFADFLIGIPSNYIQSSGGIFYLRNKYGGLFAQDSWRPGSKLTLNYGLRWDIIAPWYERNNQIQTIVPGQQSVVYPEAPTGLVFPTDPGIARGLSPAQFGSISPAMGAATRRTTDDISTSVGCFYRLPGIVGGHHLRRAALRL
jgi:hypothetical protein